MLMAFDRRHYVPVVKWKQGEQKALETLTPTFKERVTPLIEIPPIEWDFENDVPKKTVDEHLVNFGETMQRSWPQKAFVDLLYIHPSERMASGLHPLTYIQSEARSRQIPLVPVTSSDRDVAHNAEVVAANQVDHLGAAIRLTERDFDSLQPTIDSLLRALQMSPGQIDLVIDHGYSDPAFMTRTTLFLTGLIDTLPYLHEWRNIILCGTGFPKNLSDVGANTIDQIERSEWIIWKRIMRTGTIKREPIFGDYGISNPEPFEGDPRFINMSANIRYTADDKFLIFKGLVTRRYGNGQYHQLADQVVRHPEYSGRNFSAGDLYIDDVAQNKDGPGNATSWRKAGTNHHLTYVINELATVTLT